MISAAIITGLKALAGLAAYVGLSEALNQVINNPRATESDARKLYYQISNKASLAGINIDSKASNALIALDQLLNQSSNNTRKAVTETKKKIQGYVDEAKQLRNDVAELEGQAQGVTEDISRQNAFTKKKIKREREQALSNINSQIKQKSAQLEQIERRIQ